MKQATPYGAWASPIAAADVAATDSHPNWPGFVGEEIWWSERLPHEGGRTTLMRRDQDGGSPRSALPAPWNVRSRLMEYGGRAWAGTPTADGHLVVFVHAEDQRVYAFETQSPGARPQPITPAPTSALRFCFADPVFAPPTGETSTPAEVWCVRESTGADGVPVRDLVAVPLDGSASRDSAALRSLADGSDFLSGPRLSPDGRSVAWIGWDNPNMPWDASQAFVADVRPGGALGVPRVVAGGPEESVAQVVWTDDGRLYVITDRSGWWNVHRASLEGGEAVNVCPREEEFAGALTKLGLSWCAPLSGGRLAVVHGTHSMQLSVLHPASGELRGLPSPRTEWAPLLASRGDRLVAIGAGAESDFAAIHFDTAEETSTELSFPRASVDPAYLPRPEGRTFEGPDDSQVHAVVFPPRNPGHTGMPGERPPFVVFAHSGPTARFSMAYDLQIAYLTSRGIGVVGVNYSGSTGYGREYRNRLRNSWGIADAADCAAVARALAAEGSADPRRLAIRGASAGGWTAAVSLTSQDVYCCAALLYPVLDPVAWRASQKGGFEAFYLDTLIGPWPKADQRYLERSPAHAAARVKVPFLLLQGSADPICPPGQAELFLSGVRADAAPYLHRVFDGERHGFKRSETIIECVEAEFALYRNSFVTGVTDATACETDADRKHADSIHAPVREQAFRTPDRIAVRDDTGSWTYRELLSRTTELAAVLRSRGVRPGDRIAIHLDRSRDLVAGMLAVLTIGCAYLPLDPDYPADRLRFMVEDARPAALLTRRGSVPPPGDHHVVHVDAYDGGTPIPPAHFADEYSGVPGDAAVIVYTSGSTGTPKGVVLTHRGIAEILRYSRDDFGFTEQDSVLALAPFSFDFAQLEILLPLICGGTTHLVDRSVVRDPKLLDDALVEREATFVMGTPSMFAALTAYGWRPPRHLRIVSGGEALSPALATALGSAGELWNIYGPTETSIYSLSERVHPDTVTLGRPAAHTVIEILKDGRRCAVDETGEIHIGGCGLATGYLGRPELTAERFISDPFRPGERLYRSGDLGRRRPDGRIVYEGRADHQVKIRGHRVEPGEVEEQLLGLPGVRAAAVVAEQGHHSLRLVGYVVTADGADADTGELRRRLARILPAFAVPQRLVRVHGIPLSPNGKTDRRALRELAAPGASDGAGLAKIWRDVLGVHHVSGADNFFELGGDSLSAMEVAIRAGDLGLRIRPADVYATRTLDDLADRASARSAEPAVPAAEPVDPTASAPSLELSPAQHRFLDWNYRDRDHYNVSLLLDVTGPVDREALAEALARLAERHPALRLRLTGTRAVADPYLRAEDVPLSWHELPDPGVEDPEQAFLKEADLLQRSLSLRQGPVWRAAFHSGPSGGQLLLIFHHFVADGMSLKIIARELSSAYAGIVEGRPLPDVATCSWADHATTLGRFANGPLGELFLRRWQALPWESLRPLSVDNPAGSMHLSHIRTVVTVTDLPVGIGDARVEELLISALATAAAEETGSRTGAVEVCRHGRTDPTGGAGFLDAVGWLNSIAPYVLSVPEHRTDAQIAASLRDQIADIRDMEQTWGALLHLHEREDVRVRLAALPGPEIYLNYLGSRMSNLELASPFRVREGGVGTEMTPDRTQPYRIKVYAKTEAGALHLRWQYSADVHQEAGVRRIAAAFEHWLARLSR
ncbi:amino acid adenylation domain-containing protein [Streptomyces sp. NPDC005775]|uniref:amino acid adenylation domain-containing protein n=1 Tax=Streptomyces sp. NPDC005775 TaxID=3364729 RepID=UPI0036B03FC2